MSVDSDNPHVTEPAKKRPVLYDVDVAVAGSGLCSTFAAIAAGRCGAKTLVVERFGSLGGNIGPGMVVNGGIFREEETTLPGGLSGIAREFVDRLKELQVGPQDRYPEDASISSFLAYEMMRDAGVELLLSAYASDPIVEDATVRGLFVECKFGRVAVKAKVTIDGTGDAEVAFRAGGPLVPFMPVSSAHPDYFRPAYINESHPAYYNDTQLLCLVAGVDLAKFGTFCEQDLPLADEDREWGEHTGLLKAYPSGLIPALRRAQASGDFSPKGEVLPNVRLSTSGRFADYGSGVVPLHITCAGAIDASDPKQLSLLEGEMRAQAFRAVRFYQQNAPGFENAYLLACAPFLGMRGGPHIEGEYTLTPEDAFAGLKCEDVLFRNIHEHNHGGDASGFDVPYAITVPMEIDGLLVCGRGAAYLRRGHDPTGMRARPSMMVFGQCVGTAGAVAALDRVTPKSVDIKKVQRRLIADGIVLGEDSRLVELGLG